MTSGGGGSLIGLEAHESQRASDSSILCASMEQDSITGWREEGYMSTKGSPAWASDHNAVGSKPSLVSRDNRMSWRKDRQGVEGTREVRGKVREWRSEEW